MRLLLARHGESTWNAEGRYQGRRDAPLSERGKRQAAALAAALSAQGALRPRTVVSSPLSRARDTALASARALGLEVLLDEDLIEISHGSWEGLLVAEIEQRWPEMYAQWRSTPQTVRFPGGESIGDVVTRWRAFVSRVEQHAAPVLVVTHDVIVRAAVMDARRQPLSAFNTLRSENAAITELDWNGERLELIRFNDAAHLGELRADPSAQAL